MHYETEGAGITPGTMFNENGAMILDVILHNNLCEPSVITIIYI